LRQLLYLIAIAILFASCKSSSVTTKRTNNNHLADEIINAASENIGICYKTAGTTKAGYDCSGLVFSIFKLYDINLPRTSFEQSKTGIELGKNLNKAKKGDLIFFKTNSKSQINHVGIVIAVNNDDIQFIHTSTSKGVIISSTKEPYYKRTFAQLNRILF